VEHRLVFQLDSQWVIGAPSVTLDSERIDGGRPIAIVWRVIREAILTAIEFDNGRVPRGIVQRQGEIIRSTGDDVTAAGGPRISDIEHTAIGSESESPVIAKCDAASAGGRELQRSAINRDRVGSGVTPENAGCCRRDVELLRRLLPPTIGGTTRIGGCS
jgi:hypothetical protein